MRLTASFCVLSVALWAAGGVGAGCVKRTCREKSARVELKVTFSDFSTATAQRIEFDSTLSGYLFRDGQRFHFDRRIGTMPFPEEARDGEMTFLLDPGRYMQTLQSGETLDYTLLIRVYGSRGAENNVLLAEGRWSKNLSPTGCYMDQSMTVSPSNAGCDGKREGDPCVDQANDYSVCAGPDQANLTCGRSECGDGYTDVRAGELCDPGQSGTAVTCAPNCLPLPVEADVSAPAAGLVVHPGVMNDLANETSVRGFYEVDPTSSATPDLTGSILAADLDGDTAHELVMALPRGVDFSEQTRRPGKVVVDDWPINADKLRGSPALSQFTLLGNYDTTADPESVYWLGASVAAGDVDGNGINDLIVGAPLRGGDEGAVVVIRGGEALTDSSDGVIVTADHPADIDQYLVLAGGARYGYAVAAADFNGDGLEDVVASSPEHSDWPSERHGGVTIHKSEAEAWSTTGEVDAYWHFSSVDLVTAKHGGMMGIALAAGDLDGDGFKDLVIGSQASPDATPPAGAEPAFGGFFVVFGGEDFFERLSGGAVIDVDRPAVPPYVLRVLAADRNSPIYGIGGAVAAADLDHDGMDELAVTVGRPGSTVEPSAVYIIKGSAVAEARAGGTPLDLDADALRLEGPPSVGFGARLFSGDLNGDRNVDLVIGAPASPDLSGTLANAGAVYVVLGSRLARYWDAPSVSVDELFAWDPANPVTVPLAVVYGGRENGFFGTSVAATSHLAQAYLDPANAYTLVFEPGWVGGSGSKPACGRVWFLYLPALYPCGNQTACARNPAPQD